MNSDDDRERIFALIEKYCRLGSLLDENLDTTDSAAVAEPKVVLAEIALAICRMMADSFRMDA